MSRHKHEIMCSYDTVFKDVHQLPVNQYINYNLSLMMYRIYTQQCPDNKHGLVTLNATSAKRARLGSASSLSYRKPSVRTKFGECAFSYSIPTAWISLPDYLLTTNTTNSFKLKTHLFNEMF